MILVVKWSTTDKVRKKNDEFAAETDISAIEAPGETEEKEN